MQLLLVTFKELPEKEELQHSVGPALKSTEASLCSLNSGDSGGELTYKHAAKEKSGEQIFNC